MSRQSPRVTAIIRCYNNERDVGRAIESLLRQNGSTPLETIVVDDASTDDSWQRIQEYSGIASIFRLPRNSGSTPAAYFALERARGEYFFTLDADDTLETDFVPAFVAALDQNRDAAFAYCDYMEVEEASGEKQVVHVDDALTRMLACNAMFRIGIVKEIGFWDSKLMLPEYDFLVRLLERHPAIYVPRVLYCYNRHDRAMTRRVDFLHRAFQELSQRHAERTGGRDFEELRISQLGETRRFG